MHASFLVAVHEAYIDERDGHIQQTFLGVGILLTDLQPTFEAFKHSLLAMLNSNTLQVNIFIRLSLPPQTVLSLGSCCVRWESSRRVYGSGGFGEMVGREAVSYLYTAEDVRVALDMVVARGFRDCLHVCLWRERADRVAVGQLVVDTARRVR